MTDLHTNPPLLNIQPNVKDVVAVEVIDIPPASPRQDEVIGYNNSFDIREPLCCSPGKLEDDLVEKSSVHEISTTIEATLLSSSPEDMVPIKLPVDEEDGGAHDKARSTPIKAKLVSEEENPVVKKLLRQWRYFDSGDLTFCLEGRADNSVDRKRRKPCYVCGDVQHNGKKCRKRRTCYTCNGKGHISEDCPKSDKMYDICLKCGDSGHDLFSCSNDYPPDDLENIRCYVCYEVGHLCCGGYIDDTDPTSSSCCNCGELGHSGFECPKPRLDKGSSQPPSICYKCGEQDHVGRYCTVTNTRVPGQKCVENRKGEILDPNKSDLVQDESEIADPVFDTDDASRRQRQRRATKNKAFRYRRVRKQKKWSTDSIAE